MVFLVEFGQLMLLLGLLGICFVVAMVLLRQLSQKGGESNISSASVGGFAPFVDHVTLRFSERVSLLRTAFWGDQTARQIDLTQFDATHIHQPLLKKNRKRGRYPKRLLDITLSLTMILVLFPLLLVVAVLIKIDSPGTVFYRQRRVGVNGRLFDVIKFRSMVNDAEKDGAKWAQKNDTRITRLGKFLRRSRIDEIPQAINVLKGEMSFVGPRPERPEFVQLLGDEIPHYNDRHKVKPGITGWAQVEYEYGASVDDAREKLTYDLYYIKNFSIILDIIIILKTVRVTLFGVGSR